MGKLDNNSLVIVGDGEMRNALMKKAKKMHKADNIIFWVQWKIRCQF